MVDTVVSFIEEAQCEVNITVVQEVLTAFLQALKDKNKVLLVSLIDEHAEMESVFAPELKLNKHEYIEKVLHADEKYFKQLQFTGISCKFNQQDGAVSACGFLNSHGGSAKEVPDYLRQHCFVLLPSKKSYVISNAHYVT